MLQKLVMYVFIDFLKILSLYFILFRMNVGVVFMATDTRHGFEDGSYVTFHGVKGMTEVNGKEFKITVPSFISISLVHSIENF